MLSAANPQAENIAVESQDSLKQLIQDAAQAALDEIDKVFWYLSSRDSRRKELEDIRLLISNTKTTYNSSPEQIAFCTASMKNINTKLDSFRSSYSNDYLKTAIWIFHAALLLVGAAAVLLALISPAAPIAAFILLGTTTVLEPLGIALAALVVGGICTAFSIFGVNRLRQQHLVVDKVKEFTGAVENDLRRIQP